MKNRGWCSRFSVSATALSAFSLIEIMLAVALMTIIVLGLLAMFYQTQRAMRIGTTQVDVMSTGDAAMQMITRELKEIVAGGDTSTNLLAVTPYQPLFWTRTFSKAGLPQTTFLQELFFIRRQNQEWIGTGYFIDPITDQGGAGVLYRFERIEPVWRSNALERLREGFRTADRTTAPRLAERIAHLQVRAFNADGSNILGNGRTNLPLGELEFIDTLLPAYIDVELGVLEPKVYERFRARHDSNDVNTPFALAYLTNQLDRLHLFRQRIPIRTVQ